MTASRSTIRGLAWFAIAAQVAFVAAWLAAGALDAAYSHIEQGVGDLTADDTANPGIGRAALVVLGVSFAALGPALLAVLPHRRSARVAAFLFAGAGVTMAIEGLFPLDCAIGASERCEDLTHAGELSWQHYVHLWSGLAFDLFYVLTPFALAWALRPSPASAAAMWSGVFGVVFLAVLFALFQQEGVAGGLLERVGWVVVHQWAFIVAGGVLFATRRRPEPGPLIAMRPRDFFARGWSGEGEILLRPFFLGRLFAQRFRVRRRSTWISDRVWRFDDEAWFVHGRVDLRHNYCEFVSDEHVQVTAGDLPDGADLWLEEDGLRISPFRLASPIGPIPVLVRCHDRSYVESDGTFVNSMDVCTPLFDIPLARVTFRVRADEPGPSPEDYGSGERGALVGPSVPT
jgi:Protein of unknown function (DUF998)